MPRGANAFHAGPGDVSAPGHDRMKGTGAATGVIFFEWDPRKEKSNRRKHGVSFSEAATVFDSDLAKIFHDSDHSVSEMREVIIGYSSNGRLLLVSFTEPAKGEVRMISAREATRMEKTDYEETE